MTGVSFHKMGRFGCGIGVVRSQFSILPEMIAAVDKVNIGEVRFGSSS